MGDLSCAYLIDKDIRLFVSIRPSLCGIPVGKNARENFSLPPTRSISLTRTLFLSHTLSIYANELCNWFDKISVKRRRVGGWEQNKAIYSIVSWQQQLVSLEWVFLLVRYLSNGQENDRYEINKAPLIESTITKIESTMSVTMDTLLCYDKLRHVYFGTNKMKK